MKEVIFCVLKSYFTKKSNVAKIAKGCEWVCACLRASFLLSLSREETTVKKATPQKVFGVR